jgi:S-adenosylmethionine decarboxylase
MTDVNVYQENIFHSKMLLKDFDIDNYIFGAGREEFSEEELVDIERRLKREMLEIFYSRNVE